MKKSLDAFEGFPKQAFDFMQELSSNNNVDWFGKNRTRYDEYIVRPARAFVVEIGEFFNRLNPAIRTEPKFNHTLMRINKDMRFSKGEPYRTYFLIHFGRFKLDSEFYVSLEPQGCSYGLFINNSEENPAFYFKENMSKYESEFQQIAAHYGINGRFSLVELKKGPVELLKNFDATRDFQNLVNTKLILLDRLITPEAANISASDFLLEAIRTYSVLYPFYCFAISPDPLKMIEEFEDQMGVPL